MRLGFIGFRCVGVDFNSMYRIERIQDLHAYMQMQQLTTFQPLIHSAFKEWCYLKLKQRLVGVLNLFRLWNEIVNQCL